MRLVDTATFVANRSCSASMIAMNQESSTSLNRARKVKYKVFAYITNRNRLLVFVHPFAPEAGIQVPAGTVKTNELPEEAVSREAFEETGLSDLIVDGFLGEHERDVSDFGHDEIHHRRFYHLRCEGNPPVTWRHEERDSSDDPKEVPIMFEFFWAPLPHDVPTLIAGHGQMIPQLLKKLSLGST
jgi:8-oxo-dGTP diphosphatase